MDVSGYTRMTEEAGDEEAVSEALRFVELVEAVAAQTGGRIVKVLGDGVMTHFDDANGAVRAAVLLVGRASAAGVPAARAGINTGPMVRRDGDYFGSVVNIAARAADYARPREVLVTDAVVEAWSGGDGIIFNGIGAVALKNVRKRIELYRAAPDDTL
jgi:adenylate cyclase